MVELHPYATLDKTVPHTGTRSKGRIRVGSIFRRGGAGRRLYTRTIMYSTVQWLSFSVFESISFRLVKYLSLNVIEKSRLEIRKNHEYLTSRKSNNQSTRDRFFNQTLKKKKNTFAINPINIIPFRSFLQINFQNLLHSIDIYH